jgi:hypothetical protein
MRYQEKIEKILYERGKIRDLLFGKLGRLEPEDIIEEILLEDGDD